MSIEIREVTTKDELKQFVKYPFELYKGVEQWIPPIIQSEIDTFSKDKNTVFTHSEAIIYTAWKNNIMVGRIVGLINQMEVDFLQEKHARFGWIDFIEDDEVSASLIRAVENWAREKGMTLLKGPFGFNQLDKNGMLTEGFDTVGTVNTIYNYEYYPTHLRSLGYTPDLEWLEILMFMPDKPHERFMRYSDLAKQKYGLNTRQPKSKSEMISLGKLLFDLLMETYQNLPGFVPISEVQQQEYILKYIKFLRRDLVTIVYDSDENPIAFGVTIPSMTKAYKIAKGHLFPFGLINMMIARQWNNTADLALIGVTEEWRKRGAHGLVFAETSKALINAGMKRIQINPMLESNSHVLSLWKDFDNRIYKRRKTFKKEL